MPSQPRATHLDFRAIDVCCTYQPKPCPLRHLAVEAGFAPAKPRGDRGRYRDQVVRLLISPLYKIL